MGKRPAVGAGVTCTKEIAESMREKVHFNTYGGNPVSMAGGLAVVECIERNNYAHNAKSHGRSSGGSFDKLTRDHKIVGEHRGKGLMRGLEIVKDKQSKRSRSAARPAGDGVCAKTVGC